MKKLLDQANDRLLIPAQLNMQHLETVLGGALQKQVDAADLYCQLTYAESWYLEDGIIKEGSYHEDGGFGLRVISEDKVGFAFSNELALPAIEEASRSAVSIVKQGQTHALAMPTTQIKKPLYISDNPIGSLKEVEKIALLKKVEQRVRARDPRIMQVMVQLSGQHDTSLLLHTEVGFSADVRPMVSLSIRVIAEQAGRREQGYAACGARSDYHYFTDEVLEPAMDKAVRQALTNLEAKPAPAGTFPVVLGPGWPAVLLHEAVGHGLEGDFNRKGSSAFSGRLGESVASPLCTVVDDGTMPDRRGSLTVDDEGTGAQRTVLIENGVLKNYMQDRLNAKLMGMEPTGNGRRESFASLPLPRMTNTYMLAGESTPEEIISSVQSGLYAVDFSGGQVDITSGKFVFSASEAYWIENGKVTHPVVGATLIGNGPDVLTRVSMVGNDLKMDSGMGMCGKEGQSVPVGVGQPTLKIDQLVVGGSQ